MSRDLIERLKHTYVEFGGLRLNFQRTCKVPQGKINSLPAGLGPFPVFKVSDFRKGCPKEWRDDGYFFPMYRQEAMWINFCRAYIGNPKALIIGAGNINAVTGKPFDPSKDKFGKKKKIPKKKKDTLDIKLEKEQNYLVVPPQPWLDGWKAEDGKIYQFVAAEMGSGETVEGQITGEETVGGIQFIVYDAIKELKPKTRPIEHIVKGDWGNVQPEHLLEEIGAFESGPSSYGESICCFAASTPTKSLAPKKSAARRAVRSRSRAVTAMGLGRGGEIIQKIYPDPYGLDVWKNKPKLVEVVYLVSSEDFKQVTGHEAPPTPVNYKTYEKHGYPWFELDDKKYKDTKGSDIFEKLKPVGAGKAKK